MRLSAIAALAILCLALVNTSEARPSGDPPGKGRDLPFSNIATTFGRSLVDGLLYEQTFRTIPGLTRTHPLTLIRSFV